MFEPENIFFLLVFIALPVGLGVWALLIRRSILQRGSASRRKVVARPRASEQPTTEYASVAVQDDQATTHIPQRDWASHVRPVRQGATNGVRLNRRRFYPPRYAGRSGGVVKRVTPRAARSFLRIRSSAGG